jgi:hypothetical protein
MITFAKIIDFYYFQKKSIVHILLVLVKPLYAKIFIAISILGNALNWGFVYLISKNITGERAILHYNVDFGINLIGDEKQLYIIPLIGLLVIIINFFILFIYYNQRNIKFVASFLYTAGIITNLFLFLSLASIYLINLT